MSKAIAVQFNQNEIMLIFAKCFRIKKPLLFTHLDVN